jgi:NAD(P)-dependent dehydrogenase (short-subunit alcohol dehydrogenase family)
MKLSGRCAIVTGGARGIGRAIVTRLACEAANVVVADINIEAAEKVIEEIKCPGSRSKALKVDVCNRIEVEGMVDAVVEEFGAVDILINNAGITGGEKQTVFSESSEDTMELVIHSNLMGTLNCSRAVINQMIRRRRGKIVSIASTAGLVGTPAAVDYSAAKAGIIGFTMALAKEVACYGINVNCVAPGNTDTDMNRKMIAQQGKAFDTTRVLQSSGLGRIAKPDEIAAMVAFLTTDDADFITGQVFPVCGLRNIGIS